MGAVDDGPRVANPARMRRNVLATGVAANDAPATENVVNINIHGCLISGGWWFGLR